MRAGLRPLYQDDRIQEVVYDWVITHPTSHRGFGSRAAAFSFPVGEVVAWGYATPQAAVAGWLRSPGHRSIILDLDATRCGFHFDRDYYGGIVG